MDAAGDLFIADSGNNVIREVNLATGMITTVAGNGDSAAATAAMAARPPPPSSTTPWAWPWTPPGTSSSPTPATTSIREVNLATGVITTVAGNGTRRLQRRRRSRPPPPNSTTPQGVAVDAAGDLFIADTGNNVIREVEPSTGVITTVAGTGAAGYSGDGGRPPPPSSTIPSASRSTTAGELFIADSDNNVIRKIIPLLYWDPAQTGTEDSGGWAPGRPTTMTSFGTTRPSARMWPGATAAMRFLAGTAGTVTISGTVCPASITFDTDHYLIVNATSSDSLMLPPGGTSINVEGRWQRSTPQSPGANR